MNADNIKIRCSSLGAIMTDPRSGSGLSETCKTHLTDVFISNRYGRNKDIISKAIVKGLKVEEDSITLFSRIKKIYFKKNEQTLENDFIKGTPDIFMGEEITKATRIIDIKSSYDIYTYFKSANGSLNKTYFYQLQGYMALTGAQSATLAYCLVNTPDRMIQDAKRKLSWQMGLIDSDIDNDYMAAAAEIDWQNTYEDIPLTERLFEIEIARDEAVIEKIYSRVIQCREYMNDKLFKIQKAEAA